MPYPQCFHHGYKIKTENKSGGFLQSTFSDHLSEDVQGEFYKWSMEWELFFSPFLEEKMETIKNFYFIKISSHLYCYFFLIMCNTYSLFFLKNNRNLNFSFLKKFIKKSNEFEGFVVYNCSPESRLPIYQEFMRQTARIGWRNMNYVIIFPLQVGYQINNFIIVSKCKIQNINFHQILQVKYRFAQQKINKLKLNISLLLRILRIQKQVFKDIVRGNKFGLYQKLKEIIQYKFLSQMGKFQGGFNLKGKFILEFCIKLKKQLVQKIQADKKNGRIKGLEINLENNVDFQIFLPTDADLKIFEKFILVLSRKYIKQKGFHEQFKAEKIVGKGMSAAVYRAHRVRDGSTWAVKAFSKTGYLSTLHGRETFENQFKILTKIDHKNVLKLFSVYETQNSMYMVTEFLHMNLLEFIKKYGWPNLEVTKFIIINLLMGLEYLHAQKIMHRDLKLENIMLRHERQNFFIPVIVDFGLAELTDSQFLLNERGGTPGYSAPQILSHQENGSKIYNQACDIFSLGVICHILLFKRPIFIGQNVQEVLLLNRECQIDFSDGLYEGFSQQCIDFIKKMTQKDLNKRIRAKEALQHPFLQPSDPIKIMDDGSKVVKFLSQTIAL